MLKLINFIYLHLIVIFVLKFSQFAEKPLAESDEAGNPFIEEWFENTISPLFQVSTAHFKNGGRY